MKLIESDDLDINDIIKLIESDITISFSDIKNCEFSFLWYEKHPL